VLQKNLPAHTMVVNYTKDRDKFVNFVRVCPLYHDGRVSHFIGLMERVTAPLSGHRDDGSLNDALSATDSNMAIGYPPSPLSSLSSSSSNNSSLHSRINKRKDANPLLVLHPPLAASTAQVRALTNEPSRHKPDSDGSTRSNSTTDQSTQSMSATNAESRSGSGTSDPTQHTRASDGMLPSLSGNTDRSNDTKDSATIEDKDSSRP
jgi:hypothetical protein